MFFTLAYFVSFTMAQEVTPLMIKATAADTQEYIVHSQLQNGQKISQWQQKCPQMDSIEQNLKEAQFHFLSGSLTTAKNKFQQIIELRWQCDWSLEQRQAIHYSYLRLAQMQESEVQQIQWLTEAYNLDPEIEPDPQLIPPPLVSLFKKIQAQVDKKQIAKPPFLKKFSQILRNGKILNANSDFLEAVPLRARYTFISDSYKLEVIIATLKELGQLHLEPKAWVTGNCTNYSLSDELQQITQPIKIYFDKNCIVDLNHKKPETEKFSEKILAQHAEALSTEIIPQRKSWIARNYLWLGATVLASAAIIIKMNSQGEKTTVPTATFTPDPHTAAATH